MHVVERDREEQLLGVAAARAARRRNCSLGAAAQPPVALRRIHD